MIKHVPFLSFCSLFFLVCSGRLLWVNHVISWMHFFIRSFVRLFDLYYACSCCVQCVNTCNMQCAMCGRTFKIYFRWVTVSIKMTCTNKLTEVTTEPSSSLNPSIRNAKKGWNQNPTLCVLLSECPVSIAKICCIKLTVNLTDPFKNRFHSFKNRHENLLSKQLSWDFDFQWHQSEGAADGTLCRTFTSASVSHPQSIQFIDARLFFSNQINVENAFTKITIYITHSFIHIAIHFGQTAIR